MKASSILNLAAALACASCVNVNIGSHGVQHADDVHVREPSRPFVKDDRKDVDGAWKNPANGNLISYFSDCHDESDPPLDSIVQDALTGLNDLKIDSSQTVTVQSREGRRVAATGKVDGVPSQIDLLAFKRNHCTYILTYVGVQSAFAQNHDQFEKFVQEFRAP